MRCSLCSRPGIGWVFDGNVYARVCKAHLSELTVEAATDGHLQHPQ